MLVFEPLEVDDLFEDEPCISKFVLDLHAQAVGIRATVTFDLQREQTAPPGTRKRAQAEVKIEAWWACATS